MSHGKATCVVYIGHCLSLEGVAWGDLEAHLEKEALSLGLEEETGELLKCSNLSEQRL